MIPRRAEQDVRDALGRQAAVAIIGPRQVGKTTLALRIAEDRPSIYLDLAFNQLRARRLARPLIAAINTVAGAIDRHSARLREPGPGTLFANFHVVAGAPR